MGWYDDMVIKRQLSNLSHDVGVVRSEIKKLELKVNSLKSVITDLAASQLECCKSLSDKLDRIISAVIPPLPVAFHVVLLNTTQTIGENMSTKAIKAGVDFQLLDNGTAKAVATPLDKAGLKTTLPAGTSVPVWTSSDPGVVATPDPADPTGLTVTITPATPPALVTGAVITVSATLPDGTVITGAGDPIDVIAGGPAGFQVVEQ